MRVIAKILKSNGTDGGILAGLRGVGLEEIDPRKPVFIEFDGLPVPFFVMSSVVGKEILAEGDEEGEDELDFTGWTLLNRGTPVGEITGMEPIPGNLCLYLGDRLVPLHEDFVISCDPQARILDLDLPEGLLDD